MKKLLILILLSSCSPVYESYKLDGFLTVKAKGQHIVVANPESGKMYKARVDHGFSQSLIMGDTIRYY